MISFFSAAAAVLQVLRPAVFAAGVLVLLLALLSTAVRARRVSPFGALGRLSRRVADPVFAPMERQLLRAGGQPGHAPWWTLAAVVVGGLALLSVVGVILDQVARAAGSVGAGPRGVAALLIGWTFAVLRLALLVRVLGTWVGQGRYSRWTGWAYRMTDWFMVPLGRVIPPLGVIDLTPLVAYFGLGLLQSLVAGALV